jgi:hypothetical protein
MYEADISIAGGHEDREVEPTSAEGFSSTSNRRLLMYVLTLNYCTQVFHIELSKLISP